ERRQVIEERRALGLLLALDRLYDAVGTRHLRDDRLGAFCLLQPRLVALEPEALVAWIELRVHEPVGLRDEGLDLALALDHQRQRRCLHTSERDDAADPGTAADRRGAGRVHAHEPVRLRAGARRSLEPAQL